jgi:hypothetical protein
MRWTPFLVLLCLRLAAGPAAVPATEIAAETFEYDPGELDGQAGGSGWLGSWMAVPDLSEVVDTSDEPLGYDVPGGGTVGDGGTALELFGNDDNVVYRELASIQDGDEVFISFLFRFLGTVDNNNFLGLWFDNLAFGTHTEVPCIGLKSNQGDGSGLLDLFARTSLNAEAYTEDIVAGTTYLIVGRLSKDFPGPFESYNRHELWVNPAHGDRDTPEAVATGDTLSSFTTIGIRVPNFTFEDSALIGALHLGTTWDDVVPPSPSAEPLFRRGDSDASGALNITDAIFTLSHLFLSGPAPGCRDAADSDDDGTLQITDAVYALNRLFGGGPTLPPPGSESCGPDPTGDTLDCASYPPCAE